MDPAALEELKARFTKAMDNDLNTSMAVTVLYDVLKARTTRRHQAGGSGQLRPGAGPEADGEGGVPAQDPGGGSAAGGFTVVCEDGGQDPQVEALIRARADAKKAKNFAEADRIRDELKAQGVEITDVPGGVRWKRDKSPISSKPAAHFFLSYPLRIRAAWGIIKRQISTEKGEIHMQAIILAAGMGKRLKELTQDRTKCMVQVNGVALIDRMLHQIESRHLSRIVIVVGYEGEKLMKYIDTLGIRTPIVYVQNPIYDKTNNIYSLALAKDYLCQDDTLLFESDLIFEDAVIDQLLDDPRETLALVDKYESWMDGTCVKLGPDDSIASFVPSKNFRFEEAHEYYKTVNIYKFGRHFSRTHYVPFLEAYSKALGNNEYYEQVLRVITMLDDPEIRAKRLNGQLWYEIDDIQDLDIASSMFAQDPTSRSASCRDVTAATGAIPQLLDFCYLVNPYFPPQRLIDEIQANFTPLLTQYPSGMRVNALLAARNFAVHQQNILVGNGAAERSRP